MPEEDFKTNVKDIRPTERQMTLINCPADTIFFGGARGGGKSNPLSSLVLTPFGFKRMGDIKIGDTISGKDGKPQKVIGVYPQGLQDVYEIEFIDGAKARCTLDHLWTINKTFQMPNKSSNPEKLNNIANHSFDWNVWTFGMIKDWLDKKESADDNQTIKYKNLFIPLCNAIKFAKLQKADANFVEPYTLGTLIGSGSILPDGKICLTNPDNEIIERLNKFYLWMRTKDNGIKYYCANMNLVENLRSLGLFGMHLHEKFIPESYKYASIEIRLELVRGLLDVNGTLDNHSQVLFCTTNKRLANDIQWIIWSLGGKATVTESHAEYEEKDGNLLEGKLTYGVYIRMNDNSILFNLKRKKEICKKEYNGDSEAFGRRIVGYKYIGKEECQCIRVSNPDSLYITNDFVVTHNTFGIGLLLLHRVQKFGKYFRGIFFRRSYSELEDAISQYTDLFGDYARWVSSAKTFIFRNGARVKMGYLDKEKDLKRYQGHEYALIVFDEATNLDSFNYIERMRGSLRSSHGIPCQLILSGNPGGPLHTRLKMDFIDPFPPGEILIPDGYSTRLNRTLTRCFIPSKLTDNPFLINTDYADNLKKSGTPEQVRQWLDGDWNVTQNTAFADLFKYEINVMKPFSIPPTWKIWKSYDYGSSHPWGCVWFAVSDGTDFMSFDSESQKWIWQHTISGDIFAIYELYGWTGKPNEGSKESIRTQAEKIKLVEETYLSNYKISVSIADSAIFTNMSGSNSIADEFAEYGVEWERCIKYPGSREQGYALLRERLMASRERDDVPGIFWFNRCVNCIRTIPSLQMDRDGTDKVATGNNSEDHLYDLTMYMLIAQEQGEVGSCESGNY